MDPDTDFSDPDSGKKVKRTRIRDTDKNHEGTIGCHLFLPTDPRTHLYVTVGGVSCRKNIAILDNTIHADQIPSLENMYGPISTVN